MRFAHVLGWINGRIILTILYIVIIGPYAIVRWLLRFLPHTEQSSTYWIAREQEEPTLEHLRHPF